MAWLPGYAYRKPLVLTGGSSGAQTDFQLDIDIAYVAAKMQADFDDIRFTQNNGTTLIDAWLESKVDSASAKTYIKAPFTPANGVSDPPLYMYYGKVVANYWDGGATFPFFDDFPGVSLDTDKWELVNTPDITVSGGILTIDNNAVSEYIRSKTYTTAYGKAIRTRARDYTASHYPGYIGFGERTYYQDLNYVARTTYTADEWSLSTNDGAGAESNPRLNEMTDDSYYLWDLTWLSNEAKIIKDGVTKGTNTLEIPSAPIKVALGGNVYSGSYYGNSMASFDWILVRKYVTNPPTYQFGAEESAPTAGVRPPRVFYGPFAGPFGGPI